jgi:hypothetical protein
MMGTVNPVDNTVKHEQFEVTPPYKVFLQWYMVIQLV